MRILHTSVRLHTFQFRLTATCFVCACVCDKNKAANAHTHTRRRVDGSHIADNRVGVDNTAVLAKPLKRAGTSSTTATTTTTTKAATDSCDCVYICACVRVAKDTVFPTNPPTRAQCVCLCVRTIILIILNLMLSTTIYCAPARHVNTNSQINANVLAEVRFRSPIIKTYTPKGRSYGFQRQLKKTDQRRLHMATSKHWLAFFRVSCRSRKHMRRIMQLYLANLLSPLLCWD